MTANPDDLRLLCKIIEQGENIRPAISTDGNISDWSNLDGSRRHRQTSAMSSIRPRIRARQRPWQTATIRPSRRLVEIGLKVKGK
jgi:hypothetical protein